MCGGYFFSDSNGAAGLFVIPLTVIVASTSLYLTQLTPAAVDTDQGCHSKHCTSSFFHSNKCVLSPKGTEILLKWDLGQPHNVH